MKRYIYSFFAVLALLFASQSFAMDDEVDALRAGWEEAAAAADADKKGKLEALAKQASELAEERPDDAEVHTWEGMIYGGFARESGKLQALKNAKKARKALDKAVELDPEGNEGSALVTLGLLYSSVPGRPIAFGNKDKAEEYFKKALDVRSEGADVNGYYAQFLADQGRKDEAKKYAEKAANAEPREGRENSDKAQIADAKKLLESL